MLPYHTGDNKASKTSTKWLDAVFLLEAVQYHFVHLAHKAQQIYNSSLSAFSDRFNRHCVRYNSRFTVPSLLYGMAWCKVCVLSHTITSPTSHA
mmetsp:Transcript_42188/g.111189  ORF Transcript_42188/g.111189 Transcript_42188/m.111189 type:complete len:94 (+) Transcript_42188:54-335(+)